MISRTQASLKNRPTSASLLDETIHTSDLICIRMLHFPCAVMLNCVVCFTFLQLSPLSGPKQPLYRGIPAKNRKIKEG